MEYRITAKINHFRKYHFQCDIGMDSPRSRKTNADL